MVILQGSSGTVGSAWLWLHLGQHWLKRYSGYYTCKIYSPTDVQIVATSYLATSYQVTSYQVTIYNSVYCSQMSVSHRLFKLREKYWQTLAVHSILCKDLSKERQGKGAGGDGCLICSGGLICILVAAVRTFWELQDHPIYIFSSTRYTKLLTLFCLSTVVLKFL